MSTLRPAERLSWYRGAALLHDDLADWAEYEPELLALHMRAAHSTWGVASGLIVSLTSNQRSVAVARGFAFTCSGRIIGLNKNTIVSAPEGPGGRYDLVLATSKSKMRKCGGKSPPCPDADPRPIVPATLEWHAREHPGHCRCQRCGPQPDRVPLVSAVFSANGVLSGLSYDVRPVARSRNRRMIGRGSVAGADLDWGAGPLSLWARIETGDALFTSTPLYFASLHGMPYPASRVIGPWLAISSSLRKSFILTLRFAARPTMSAQALITLMRSRIEKSTVNWFGVEQYIGCGGPTIELEGFIPNLTGPSGGGS